MTYLRWEPVPARLFTSLFDTPTAGAPVARRFTPATDIVESDTHYILRADLPGVSEDDIAVQLDRNVLSISGERTSQSEQSGAGVHRFERRSGSFRRSVRLPEGVQADAITATFDRGVLEVSVAKPAAATPHRIAVTAGAPAQPADGAQALESPDDVPAADEAAGEPVAA